MFNTIRVRHSKYWPELKLMIHIWPCVENNESFNYYTLPLRIPFYFFTLLHGYSITYDCLELIYIKIHFYSSRQTLGTLTY